MYFTCLVKGKKSYYYHAESYRDQTGSPRRVSLYIGNYATTEKYIRKMDVDEEKQKLLLQRLKEMEEVALEKINIATLKKRDGNENNTDIKDRKERY